MLFVLFAKAIGVKYNRSFILTTNSDNAFDVLCTCSNTLLSTAPMILLCNFLALTQQKVRQHRANLTIWGNGYQSQQPGYGQTDSTAMLLNKAQ